MTTITVRLARSEVTKITGNHPVHQGIYVVKKLREKKIPVRGLLGIEGIEHGKLSLMETTTEHVYEWIGTLPVDDEEF